MKKIFVPLVFLMSVYARTEAKLHHIDEPTPFIMQYLTASTTVWRGSDYWKDYLNEHQETIYKDNAVEIKYKIKEAAYDQFIVETTVKELRAFVTKDPELFKKLMLTDDSRETIFDYSTECYLKTKIENSNPETGDITISKSGTCKSYILKRALREKIHAKKLH